LDHTKHGKDEDDENKTSLRRLDVVRDEVLRQYEEINEAKGKITYSGIPILLAITTFLFSELFKIDLLSNCLLIWPYTLSALFLVAGFVYAFKCLHLKEVPIGVNVNSLIQAYDNPEVDELHLKGTVVHNLGDCWKNLSEYYEMKTKYYKTSYTCLFIGFILFIIVKIISIEII
jgi:hypothetical protein